MSEKVEMQTVRTMPKWGWAGWIVLLVQLLGHAVTYDSSDGMSVTVPAMVIAALAFTAGVAGIAVMLSRRAQ